MRLFVHITQPLVAAQTRDAVTSIAVIGQRCACGGVMPKGFEE